MVFCHFSITTCILFESNTANWAQLNEQHISFCIILQSIVSAEYQQKNTRSPNPKLSPHVNANQMHFHLNFAFHFPTDISNNWFVGDFLTTYERSVSCISSMNAPRNDYVLGSFSQSFVVGYAHGPIDTIRTWMHTAEKQFNHMQV